MYKNEPSLMLRALDETENLAYGTKQYLSAVKRVRHLYYKKKKEKGKVELAVAKKRADYIAKK